MSKRALWRTQSVPSSNPGLRFRNILEEIDLIEQCVAGRSIEAVAADRIAVRAIERCLSIISEAATKLGDQAQVLSPGIPWQRVRALGNLLRHAYDDVVFDELWVILQEFLPALRSECRSALLAIEKAP